MKKCRKVKIDVNKMNYLVEKSLSDINDIAIDIFKNNLNKLENLSLKG